MLRASNPERDASAVATPKQEPGWLGRAVFMSGMHDPYDDLAPAQRRQVAIVLRAFLVLLIITPAPVGAIAWAVTRNGQSLGEVVGPACAACWLGAAIMLLAGRRELRGRSSSTDAVNSGAVPPTSEPPSTTAARRAAQPRVPQPPTQRRTGCTGDPP